MDYGDQRPPRAARPPSHQPSSSQSGARPHLGTGIDGARPNVSFQDTERGDRSAQLDQNRQRNMPHAYQNNQVTSPRLGDPESGEYFDPARVGRKKSLVRPDREKIEPGHRQWHYHNHVMQAENDGNARLGVLPSTTGNYPQREGLRRGRSLLAREEDVHESGLALFKRGATLRRRRTQPQSTPAPSEPRKRGCMPDIGPGPHNWWMYYCFFLTCCMPTPLLRGCGIRSPDQQRAWREKMGLLSIILGLMAGVGFLTFGFTEAVCGKPPNRFHSGSIGNGSVIIHGYDYDFSNFKHPQAGSTFNGQTNPLLEGGWGAAGGDISFMFQNVNQHCLGLITKASTSSISGSGENLDWYFPCNIYNQFGTSGVNLSAYEQSTNCHLSSAGSARTQLASLQSQGQVFYTWDDVHNPSRNLALFESTVLDLDLLQWLNKAQVNYPSVFDEMAKANGTYNSKDLTMMLLRTGQRDIGTCLQDIITVGFIDTNSIGCVASQVVLYLSLVFIVGVVAIRFVMAVMFAWFFSWKIGTFPRETYEQRMQRSAEIENWTNDIYRPAPSQYRPNVGKQGISDKKANRKTFLPSTSRFTPETLKSGRPTTQYGMLDAASAQFKRATMYGGASSPSSKSTKLTPPDTPSYRQSRSTMSFADTKNGFVDNPCPFPLQNVVPQPPPDYEPFNFPLAHTICLVTAYSESIEGLRTTLDSLATTDYPNSHKVILVIADGMVKGAGNDLTTPEICLTMMKEFVIPPSEVEAHSYVAIADGHKRHNMAKVYAGFYDYDNATIERSKQQRVPIVVVAKVGNPLEADDVKPGNRGKRDSQIVLMAFLQKVMFDERMTTFEYEFFNSLWRVTGVSPDRYELVLCVDADTKVFPDSLTRMASCMVTDPEIMGLCGETKIANKGETFVTMMQVFEYYISHHMTKAFESMFGGVTCLPGCFSMYRIKAPKGDSSFWVPILANPDIVEHYSENVVDTLHKKNLLLLGEDRYLTTLLLKTFPKRKNMFCPQAVCKTVVPDTFRVLLSQRRRWINSTIHNLAELLLVRDLCGTFCFSMQFVVGMELAGTLVLPAAITFTLYLIIVSIIPGGTNTTIPLVLLAVVLGLPGVLIVITSRKLSYVGWMLVYLLSLPIWNGILPAYAFWHFDDFSWGQTRKVSGEDGNHGDKDGEFDSTHIVMKRWAEFERDRRWKSGTQSRDSVYWDKRGDSNRLSVASNSDTYHSPSGGFDSSTLESSNYTQTSRPRHDSNTLLMLPAPLSVSGQSGGTGLTSSSTVMTRSSEDTYSPDPRSSSNQRLIPSPQPVDSYDASPDRRPLNFESQVSRATGNIGTLRSSTSMSQYPGETQNPFRNSQPLSVGFEDHQGFSVEPEEYASPVASRGYPAGARGVSLSDTGPVPGPDGVRRVSRAPGKRSSSQAPLQTSPPAQQQTRPPRNASPFGLPPGAAPPQPNYQSGGYN